MKYAAPAFFLFLLLLQPDCFAQRMDPAPLLQQARAFGREAAWISDYIRSIEKKNTLPKANTWLSSTEQVKRLQAFDRSRGDAKFDFLLSLVRYDLQFPGLIWEDSLDILEKHRGAPGVKKLVSHLIGELKKLDTLGRENFNPLLQRRIVDGVMHFTQGSIVQHAQKQSAMIKILARLKAVEARPLMLEYLTRPKAPVSQAMHYFRAMGQKEVLTTLLDDPRDPVSTLAARILARYSFETGKWDLGQEENLAVLLAHPRESVNRTALWELGMHGDPRGFALLVEYLHTGRTGIKGQGTKYVPYAHGLRVLAVLRKHQPEGSVAAVSKWIDVIQRNIDANARLQAENLRKWGRGYLSMDRFHERLVAIAHALGDIGGQEALAALSKIKTGGFQKMTLGRDQGVISNKPDSSLSMAVWEARKKILAGLPPQ